MEKVTVVYSQSPQARAERFANGLDFSVTEYRTDGVFVTGRRQNGEDVALRFEQTPKNR